MKRKARPYPYYLMVLFLTIYGILMFAMCHPIFMYYINKEDCKDVMIHKMEVDKEEDVKPLPIIDIIKEQPILYDKNDYYIDNDEIYVNSNDDAINELKEMVNNDVNALSLKYKL